MLDLFSVVTGTEGQFISEATVKKTSLRVISENFDMTATQLVIRLQRPVNTVEGSWMQKKCNILFHIPISLLAFSSFHIYRNIMKVVK